ncbi:RluA family pseudouridine synthase [Bacillus sp. DTU_2020_1000418_1_SI_GHA_SEK_038]|uniref:RluA family pseudouridine synthase n=1 Tax=Bacillus sp. DTU_2020_1000418_1_SI_GHA_SEK_038 TaxID=3077585 RepID=UPI0028EB8164|nr:RluA family pseudouridine synthase [Bacillus sp. DTU_2020_1000418_1_SI_GHA_SEK_038]WNS77552.1 RluA family pseudouridine synthase [Bacillus sp. DTU_2020_1000418_1_SI_GHA_SEK_038]
MKAKRFGEWYELTLPLDWEGFTIDYILRNIWRAPKKQIHFMRMENHVKVNGELINWNSSLKNNDKLQLRLFVDEDFGVAPSYKDVEILYEDDHVLVLNKPAHMDTHPNEERQTNTLSNAAAFYLQSQGEYRNVRHVHRLDRDTTGAVLFAKHPLAGSILDRKLEERIIKRTYMALVHGLLKTKKGIIKEPIGRDRHHATRRRVSPSGQQAITHFELIKTYPKQNLSLVKCQLETGRTHQIRVHLSHIGHPLAGDVLYGGKPIFDRQALHAAKLDFPHPFTMENISCNAPLPGEKDNKSVMLAELLQVLPSDLT